VEHASTPSASPTAVAGVDAEVEVAAATARSRTARVFCNLIEDLGERGEHPQAVDVEADDARSPAARRMLLPSCHNAQTLLESARHRSCHPGLAYSTRCSINRGRRVRVTC
jgi:hypothetical protein